MTEDEAANARLEAPGERTVREGGFSDVSSMVTEFSRFGWLYCSLTANH
jgi:hypothetical protein